MKNTAKLMLTIAAVTMPIHGAAAKTDCITKGQASSMVAYLMPGMLKRGMDECKKSLPANSALMTKGPAALTKYKTEAAAAEDEAAIAVLNIAGDDLPTQLGGKFVLPIVEGMLQAQLGSEFFDKKGCLAINNIWGPLSDLPSRKVGEALAAVILVTEEEKGKADPNKKSESPLDNLGVCPYIAR